MDRKTTFPPVLEGHRAGFCWHPETPGAGWKLTHGLRAGLVSPAAFAALYGSRCATHGHSAPGRYVCVWPRASGSGTQPFECGAFQTVEVAFARCRLLKDMLRHFKRRDGLADSEATIRDDLVQRLPHDGYRRCIVFLFQLNHRHGPI